MTTLNAKPAAPNQAAERNARAAEKGTGSAKAATPHYRPLPNEPI
ncbi:MAG: hypothetical protein QM804_14255 [Propionicimonas sp.]